MNSFTKLWLLLIFSLLIFQSSCTYNNVVDVEGSDSVSFTQLQASFPAGEKDNPGRIKISINSAEDANFTQSLPSGLMIMLQEGTFSGPESLVGRFNLSMNTAAYGIENRKNPETTLGLYTGLADVKMDLLLSSASNTIMEEDSFTGFYFEFFAKQHLTTQLYGRASLGLAFALDNTSTGMTELDIGLAYKLIKKMEIIGGIKRWSYNRSEIENQSGFLLDINGPYLAFSFLFE